MMNMKNYYKENTVILIKYPFTDLSSFKVRPALILRDQDGQDIICLPISSSFSTTSSSIELREDDTRKFVFPIRSFVRIKKISTINVNLIVKVLGSLKKKTFSNIKKITLDFLAGKSK